MTKTFIIFLLFVIAFVSDSKSQLLVPATNGQGITIGNANDNMGRVPGHYAIKFYGYRDTRNNIITSKITSERTMLCCNDANGGPYLYQGSDLAFYTTNIAENANADNSLERLRIKDNGNVGIGTSSPLAKLHVEGPGGGKVLMGNNTGPYGIVSLNGTFDDWNMISSAADRNLYFNRSAGADMWFRKGGNIDQMVLKDNGNFGIGTPSPVDKFSVTGNVSSRDANNGLVLLNGFDGGIELGSGNNSYSFVDFKGIANLNSDMQGRIAYIDETGFDFLTTGDYGSKVRIALNGNVGIGTTNPHEKLSVNGTILAKKVRVSVLQTDWSDYVFAPGYKLRSLASVQNYINKHKHLPDVPSADEVEKNGLDVGATQAALLRKIEELTLYVIAQEKKIEKLTQVVDELQSSK